jgi:Uma2 family endonuclease
MAPERVIHLRVKARVWRALADAIFAAGLSCEALPDGATVEIDEDTDYEPDALVHCGALEGDAIAVPAPVIVVEVVSPSTRAIDTGTKLTDYFRVASIQHYLILRTDRKLVIHHRRASDGAIETRVVPAGILTLDPPGIRLAVEALFGP